MVLSALTCIFVVAVTISMATQSDYCMHNGPSLSSHSVHVDGKGSYTTGVQEKDILEALAARDASEVARLVAQYIPENNSTSMTFEESGVSNWDVDIDGWGCLIGILNFTQVLSGTAGFNMSIGYGAGNTPLPSSIKTQQKHLNKFFLGHLNGNIHVYVSDELFQAVYAQLDEPACDLRHVNMAPGHVSISRTGSMFKDMLERALEALEPGDDDTIALVCYGTKSKIDVFTSYAPHAADDDSQLPLFLFHEDEDEREETVVVDDIDVGADNEFVMSIFEASKWYRYQLGATSADKSVTSVFLVGVDGEIYHNGIEGVEIFTHANVLQSLASMVRAEHDGLGYANAGAVLGQFGGVCLKGEALGLAIQRADAGVEEFDADFVSNLYEANSPGQVKSEMAYNSMCPFAIGVSPPDDDSCTSYVGITKVVFYVNQLKHFVSNHLNHPEKFGYDKARASKGEFGTGSEAAKDALEAGLSLLSKLQETMSTAPASFSGGPRIELSSIGRGGQGNVRQQIKKDAGTLLRLANSTKSGVRVCAKVDTTTFMCMLCYVLFLNGFDTCCHIAVG